MRYVCLLFICIAMASACSRSSHNDNEFAFPDNRCIERFVIKQSDPAPGLSAQDRKTADSLMDVNHIDHSDFNYVWFYADSVNGHFQQYVAVDQYANGLRLFSSRMSFGFSDGTSNYTVGHLTKGTTLDTIPTLTLSRLRALFTRDIDLYHGAVRSNVTDSCYKAEFGYYNTAPEAGPESLIKAWRVSIKYTGRGPLFGYPNDIPFAYYRDSDGKLLGFMGDVITAD